MSSGSPGEPVSDKFIDQGPFFETSGHFNTAFIIALAAGMSAPDADELAYWTEYPDRDGRYEAIRGMLWWNLGYPMQTYVHSLRGGDATPVRSSLETLLRERRGKPWAWGLYVHALGDAFAHTHDSNGIETLFRWPFGHAFHGHAPDKIGTDKGKYSRYLEALYRALSRDGLASRRCLVDDLIALVQCPQWTPEIDELGALNCFSDAEQLPRRSPPILDLTLSREAVDQWIQVVKDELEQADGAE